MYLFLYIYGIFLVFTVQVTCTVSHTHSNSAAPHAAFSVARHSHTAGTTVRGGVGFKCLAQGTRRRAEWMTSWDQTINRLVATAAQAVKSEI